MIIVRKGGGGGGIWWHGIIYFSSMKDYVLLCFFKRSKVCYFRAIFILHCFLSKNHKICMGRCPNMLRGLPYKTIWKQYTERYGYHTEQYGYHSKRKKISFWWHSLRKEMEQKITLSNILLCERRNYRKSIVLFAQSSTRRSKF